ncbi:hypothetical protein NKDENANG_02094 [Candidatus Entotheonellaceae bacterium PAL068K]
MGCCQRSSGRFVEDIPGALGFLIDDVIVLCHQRQMAFAQAWNEHNSGVDIPRLCDAALVES